MNGEKCHRGVESKALKVITVKNQTLRLIAVMYGFIYKTQHQTSETQYALASKKDGGFDLEPSLQNKASIRNLNLRLQQSNSRIHSIELSSDRLESSDRLAMSRKI